MAPAFKPLNGATNTPIELSDDESETSRSTLRDDEQESSDTHSIDVIDLTRTRKVPKEKSWTHTSYDGSLTAPTSRGHVTTTTPTQARMISPTIRAESPQVLRTIDEGDDQFDIGRELSEREARNFQRARALRHALPRGYRFLSSATGSCGIIAKPEMGVQLFQKSKYETRQYFWIKHIIQDANGDIWLRGISLKRNFDIYTHTSKLTGQPLHAILPLQTNELCMHLQGDPDTLGSPLNDDCLALICLSEVELEREIVFTNYHFNDFSYLKRGMSVKVDTQEFVHEYGVLCCRWKYVEEVSGKYGVPAQVVGLEQAECHRGMGVPDAQRRREYGKRTQNSSSPPQTKTQSTWQADVVDLTVDRTKSRKRRYEEAEEESTNIYHSNLASKEQTANRRNFPPIARSSVPRPQRSAMSSATMQRKRYTIGDICAGLGGTLRGALMAGLDPSWALDKWNIAINSLRQNWPRIRDRVLEMSIQDFVAKIRLGHDYVVDVIHISFPCQGHSWQNRGQNPEQDALNNGTITTLAHILEDLRPRIVTLEQTNGILTKNEGFWFRKVISQLTTAGYSARSKVFNMADYGLCQARKRLIVVASCPGQKLPNWPAPTHGDGPGLPPRVTLGQAVQDIPPHATAHDIEDHKRRVHRTLPVADMSVPLQHLVDTSGAKCLFRDTDGSTYWPTYRQQMRLQGFPDVHSITGSTQEDFTTQIGNAVPPVFAKKMFKEVIKALEESDRDAEKWEQEILVID